MEAEILGALSVLGGTRPQGTLVGRRDGRRSQGSANENLFYTATQSLTKRGYDFDQPALVDNLQSDRTEDCAGRHTRGSAHQL